MEWTAVGAIGEIVGAFAVVFSLVYLAKQIQANTKSTAVASTSTFLQGFFQLSAPVMENKEFAATMLQGYYGYDSLGEVERFQFQVSMLQWFNLWDSMFTLHNEGLLPDARWTAVKTQIENVLAMPGPRAVWDEAGKDIIISDLVREVDKWVIPDESLLENWAKPDAVYTAIAADATTLVLARSACGHHISRAAESQSVRTRETILKIRSLDPMVDV